MRRTRLPFLALATILAIAACGKRDPVAPDANAAAPALPAPNKARPDPMGGPPPTARPEPQPLEPAATIPAALQGRWGLTPADCTSTRGDAKGLLLIGANELRFYESRAVPAEGIESDADSISGKFEFTGEGQSWTKFQSYKLDDRRLVRTETNPNTSFTYARC
jgi:predicted small lipoprotein YifL